MKVISKVLLVLLINGILASCAAMFNEAKRIPTSGKALILAMKPDGNLELFITKVDGNIISDSLRNRNYEVEIEPGKHKIRTFCINNMGYITHSTSPEEIEIKVLAGHVYKLTASSACSTVHAKDLTATKK